MNRHNVEMIRRSPRLVSKGYYHPEEPRSQLVSYKESIGRTFNTRKRKKLDRVRHNLFNKSSMSNIKNMEAGDAMLPSDTLYQEDDTPPDTPPETPPDTPPDTPYDMSPDFYTEFSPDTPPDAPAGPLYLVGSSSVVKRKILPLLYFFLITTGFGICFSYVCVDKFLTLNTEHPLHNPDTQNHGVLFKEIEFLKQGVKDVRLKYKDYEKQLHRALSLHRADDVGMADYALESLGATVKSSSDTLRTKYCSLFGIGYWCQNNGPETVLQPEIHAGNCWPFKGSKGHLVIDLPCPIRITHVTLQHLPRVLSPTNQINSAPKDFAVYGLDKNNANKILGVFTYDQDGEPIQTFKLTDCPTEAFEWVQLRILSNWGHEYTCVYRFRLHSQLNCTSESSLDT